MEGIVQLALRWMRSAGGVASNVEGRSSDQHSLIGDGERPGLPSDNWSRSLCLPEMPTRELLGCVLTAREGTYNPLKIEPIARLVTTYDLSIQNDGIECRCG